MRPRRALSPAIAICAALCAMSMLPAGCTDKEKYRASVGFHAKGVRVGIQRVRDEIARQGSGNRQDRTGDGRGDYYGMRVATDHLARALRGLPVRIGKKATTRVGERKALAGKARKLFEELRPTLESLRFDKAEVNARLDELGGMIDEVERD